MLHVDGGLASFADGCWRTPPVDAADGRRDGTGVPQSDGAKFKLLSLSTFPTKHPVWVGVPSNQLFTLVTGAKFKLLSLSKLYFPTKHPMFLFSY